VSWIKDNFNNVGFEFMNSSSPSQSSPAERLPPADPYARINQLANAAFTREVLRKVNEVILPLNDQGSGPAFYCIHSITGAATDFRFMAHMLGPNQRFFGIQTPTRKRNADFPVSIEAISEYYVDSLIKFQPEGSFILGGHSIGSMIALEMAQQLRARGREVSLVVVFDGELFNTGADLSLVNPMYWIKLLSNVPRWIRDVLIVEYDFQTLYRTLLTKAIATTKTLKAKTTGEAISSGHAVEGFIDLGTCTPEHAAFMKTLFENQYAYVPKPYSGRMLVCVARTQGLVYLRQVERAWRKIAPAAEIRHFDGTHTSIMRVPQGIPIANYLAEQIAKIGRDASASPATGSPPDPAPRFEPIPTAQTLQAP
jgi:thioesterase domain-containing protein